MIGHFIKMSSPRKRGSRGPSALLWLWIPTFAGMTMVMLVMQAHATSVDKTAANTFYAHCMADRSARLGDDDRQAICACTSAQVMKTMSAEDLKAVARPDDAGRVAFSRMLVNVYAPCMDQPVRHVVTADCLRDPSVPASSGDAVCACAAKLTGDWYVLAGRQLMAAALHNDPSLTNPVGPVVALPEFTHERDKNIQSCLTEK